MRDPYILPCGHTFCLRPCLLSHIKAVTARCIHCHATFGVDELRPNHTIAMKLSPISSQQSLQQQQQQQQQHQKLKLKLKQQAGSSDACAETASADVQRTGQVPSLFVRCGTCSRPVEAKELDICNHCHHNICQQCRGTHRNNLSLIVRVKLNTLSRHRVLLKARLEQLRGSESSPLETERKSRDGIFGGLEDAVMDLRMAASKALDTATTKLEMVDATGYEVIGPLVRQLTDLLFEVSKTQDAYASLERISSLQEVVAKKKSLEKLLAEAASLEEMMKKFPSLPIMQMHLSDRLAKIDQYLSDFNLVIGNGLLSMPGLPHLLSRLEIGDRRTVTSPNVATGKSRVKLYVGGLRLNHTESQLRQHFDRYGAVANCYIARDFKTKASRGYAFVTFREESHATRALADCPHFIDGGPVSVRPFDLNKKTKATVSSVKNEGEKVGNEGEGSATGIRSKVNELRLYVGNLEPSTTRQALMNYFSEYGTVTSVNLPPGHGRTKPQGFAFVNMSTPQEVEAVLMACPHHLCGKVIVVRRAFARASRKAASISGDKEEHRLVVHDLPLQISKKSIRELFGRFGTITNVKVDQGAHKAFVDFSSLEAVQMAVAAPSPRLNDVDLRVTLPDAHF